MIPWKYQSDYHVIDDSITCQIQEIFMFMEAITKDVNITHTGSLRFSVHAITDKRDSLARGINRIAMYSCLLSFKTYDAVTKLILSQQAMFLIIQEHQNCSHEHATSLYRSKLNKQGKCDQVDKINQGCRHRGNLSPPRFWYLHYNNITE